MELFIIYFEILEVFMRQGALDLQYSYCIQAKILQAVLRTNYIYLRTLVAFVGFFFFSSDFKIFIYSQNLVTSDKLQWQMLPLIPFSIGPFTLAKTKIQKTWVLLYRLHCLKKPITFGVFGTKKRMREKTRISYWCFGKWCACVKKPESHTDVLVSGAHARLLSTFDRTRVVRITSRAAVRWFRWRSCITWPKPRIIPARLERAFTLAKNQLNFSGVSKNHAAEVVFRFGFFGVFRGSCLATFNEKPECEKDSGFFMPV